MKIKFDSVSTTYNGNRYQGLWYGGHESLNTAIAIHGTWSNHSLNTFVVPIAEVYAGHRLNFLTANFPGHDETAVNENFEDITGALDRWIDEVCPKGDLLLQGFSLGALKILYYLNDPTAANRNRVRAVILLAPYDNVAFYSGKNRQENIEKVRKVMEQQGPNAHVPQDVFSMWAISAKTYLEMTTPGNPSDQFPSRNGLGNSAINRLKIPTFVALGSEDFAAYPNPSEVHSMLKGIRAIDPYLVQGAPHNFDGKVDKLVDLIENWVSKNWK